MWYENQLFLQDVCIKVKNTIYRLRKTKRKTALYLTIKYKPEENAVNNTVVVKREAKMAAVQL